MVPASAFEAAIRPRTQTRERRLADLARRQHGIVERGQLLGLGIEPGAIKRKINAGRLHVIHRGVYAVGHTAITVRGRWLAAVLASGPGAVLSHRSATALWDLGVGVRGDPRHRAEEIALATLDPPPLRCPSLG